jgi:cytolethal distending toxin subunit A
VDDIEVAEYNPDVTIRNVQTNKRLTIAGGVSTDNNVTALQYNCDRRSVAPLDAQADALTRVLN